VKAVTWALLIIVGLLLTSFFVFIRPSFLQPVLRDQARDIAQYVAGQISFMARMADLGAFSGQRVFHIDAGSDKLVEIVVTYYTANKNGTVTVRVTSGNVYGQASAIFWSDYLVRNTTIYQGDIIITLRTRTITLANIKPES
jgi:hypothetical protein